MSSLIQTLKDFLSDQAVGTDQTLFLACSGGVDSMVLAGILVKLGYKPELVHCNFKLRDSDSDEDQELVETFAINNQLKFHCRSFDTADYARNHNLSIQIAARELRYGFFEELLTQSDQSVFVLGHHADDSLETIFINLGRGSGLMPLSGIEPVRGRYLRPFWLIPKREIIHYALDNGIRWREDLSNREDNYQRNYIRHHLVAPLKEVFPDFDKAFASTLRYTRLDRSLFRSLIEKRLESVIEIKGKEELFPLDHLNTYPEEKALIFPLA